MLVGGMSTSDCLYLWSNAWCSRIWTLQEYALASKPVVMSGDHSIPWKTYVDLTPVAAGYIASLGSTDFENSQLKVGILQLVNRMVSKGLVPPSIDPVPGWKLAYFLAYAAEISQSNESTNPLDKVYALYALLFDQIQDLPAVDYTRNQNALYQSFAMVTIRSAQNSGQLFCYEEQRTARYQDFLLGSQIFDTGTSVKLKIQQTQI